jgi:hypothetical protein
MTTVALIFASAQPEQPLARDFRRIRNQSTLLLLSVERAILTNAPRLYTRRLPEDSPFEVDAVAGQPGVVAAENGRRLVDHRSQNLTRIEELLHRQHVGTSRTQRKLDEISIRHGALDDIPTPVIKATVQQGRLFQSGLDAANVPMKPEKTE